uniref:Uncharacterized protein n=1 Tax=Clytia hemisphaerica TaxID=252671 RepID=A0A7M5VGV2_9CNID
MGISMDNNEDQLPSFSHMNTQEEQLNTVQPSSDLLQNNLNESERNFSTLQNEEQFYDAPQSQNVEQMPHYNVTETECETLNSVMDYSNVLDDEQPAIHHDETDDNKKIDFSTSAADEMESNNVQKSTSRSEKDEHLPFQFNAKQLKETLLMQLDLIQHQHLAIMEKDKQIIALRADKEQLEARLSRMERRISVQKRHSLEVATSQDDSSPLTRTRISSPLVKSPLVLSTAGSAKKTENDKSTPIDKLNMLPVTITSCNDKGFCFENFLKTNVAYLDSPRRQSLCKKNEMKNEKLNKKQVQVPAFRLVNNCDFKIQTFDQQELEEDTSDVAYDKRHSKPEQEEKTKETLGFATSTSATAT